MCGATLSIAAWIRVPDAGQIVSPRDSPRQSPLGDYFPYHFFISLKRRGILR
jgi:hypothetical protein